MFESKHEVSLSTDALAKFLEQICCKDETCWWPNYKILYRMAPC